MTALAAAVVISRNETEGVVTLISKLSWLKSSWCTLRLWAVAGVAQTKDYLLVMWELAVSLSKTLSHVCYYGGKEGTLVLDSSYEISETLAAGLKPPMVGRKSA